jgi:hypothetical protein
MVASPIVRFGATFVLSILSCRAAEKYAYNTLADLIQDLEYNEVRKDQIVRKSLDDPDIPVVTVNRVRVQSVAKDPNDMTGKTVIVMTYQIVNKSVMFGVVYFGDLLPASKAARLHHDDWVSIVGAVFSFEPHGEKPADAVRIFGVVMPAVKKLQPDKVQ